MSEQRDQWELQAGEWYRYMTPLRPHPDDTAVVERIAAELVPAGRSLEMVMLGVTAETALADLPGGTRLRAFDSSPGVVERLWPADRVSEGFTVGVASWSALPVQSASVDLAVADGSLVCISWPEEAAAVIAEVRRVLRRGGRFVARTFLRPETPETSRRSSTISRRAASAALMC